MKEYLGPIVIVITFIINVIITSNLKKGEINRQWKYKAIVELGISYLDVFFAEFMKKFKNGTYITAITNQTVKNNQKTLFAGNLNDEILKLKQQIVYPSHLVLGEFSFEFDNLIEEFRDNYVLEIDKLIAFSNYDFESIHEICGSTKAKMLKSLVSQVRAKRISIRLKKMNIKVCSSFQYE